jgi:hypothetical protein
MRSISVPSVPRLEYWRGLPEKTGHLDKTNPTDAEHEPDGRACASLPSLQLWMVTRRAYGSVLGTGGYCRDRRTRSSHRPAQGAALREQGTLASCPPCGIGVAK